MQENCFAHQNLEYCLKSKDSFDYFSSMKKYKKPFLLYLEYSLTIKESRLLLLKHQRVHEILFWMRIWHIVAELGILLIAWALKTTRNLFTDTFLNTNLEIKNSFDVSSVNKYRKHISSMSSYLTCKFILLKILMKKHRVWILGVILGLAVKDRKKRHLLKSMTFFQFFQSAWFSLEFRWVLEMDPHTDCD